MGRSGKQQSLAFMRKKKTRRGRPRAKNGAVPHSRRGALDPRHPVHVTWRVLPGLWNLQSRRVFRHLLPSFQAACERNGARITHYSVQANHVHLIVEAEGGRALSSAMKGLAIRLAKGVNKLMNRSGQVFADRFFARVLRSPTQTLNAINYVLGNTLVHFRRLGVDPELEGLPDPYCAGPQHDAGWRYFLGAGPPPVAEPRTWLLRAGWTRGFAPAR